MILLPNGVDDLGRKHRRKRHDLSKQTFGQWQPLRVVSDVNGRLKWLCRCTCGNEAVVSSSNLRSKNSTRCRDCASSYLSKVNQKYNSEQAATLRIIAWYKRRSKRKKLAFTIDEKAFQTLITASCHYCGSPPSNVCRPKRRRGGEDFYYNGVDRVDNARGYVADNVVTCCRVCNSAKADMTTEEFEVWISRLIEYHEQKPRIKSCG